MLQNSNKHKPAPKQKRKVAAYEKLNGTVTKAYEQSSGISRQQQSLEYVIVRDHINNEHQNHCRVADTIALREKNKRHKQDAEFQKQHKDNSNPNTL